MTSRLRWLPALTALTSILLLTSCVGSNSSALPNSQGISQAASVGALSELQHIVILKSRPNVSCPKRFTLGCDTVSLSTGLQITVCYGPCSQSNAKLVTWSGFVCMAKGLTCPNPIKQLTGAWTGPFKCKPKDQCKGTYELDTITPGPGLKQTQAYKYKQDSHVCLGSKCEDAYIGLNVGP
jgi:hypothetical protein